MMVNEIVEIFAEILSIPDMPRKIGLILATITITGHVLKNNSRQLEMIMLLLLVFSGFTFWLLQSVVTLQGDQINIGVTFAISLLIFGFSLWLGSITAKWRPFGSGEIEQMINARMREFNEML